MVNKQLQYTYCPISHQVKATRQSSSDTMAIYSNITIETLFFKNYSENEPRTLIETALF